MLPFMCFFILISIVFKLKNFYRVTILHAVLCPPYAVWKITGVLHFFNFSYILFYIFLKQYHLYGGLPLVPFSDF